MEGDRNSRIRRRKEGGGWVGRGSEGSRLWDCEDVGEETGLVIRGEQKSLG